jgi:uncharacterized protein with von Willebrand factor type A (vWA) domain
MRHRYFYLDPALVQSILDEQALRRLFHRLLLTASGDVEQVRRWLKELQERGFLSAQFDIEAFLQQLEAEHLLERNADGALEISAAGERSLRRTAFEELFRSLRGGPGFGDHPARGSGVGVEALAETRPYTFGDDLSRLDAGRSLQNTLRRTGQLGAVSEEDLEVQETEPYTACATVLAIDISHSMVLYGEDRITPAKEVALALAELILTRYPHDFLRVIQFGDRAEEVPLRQLPYLEAGPYHTNTRDALALARSILLRQKRPNRQIVLITDGKPSALTEGNRIYKNPYGLDLKIVNRTLEEAERCRRHGIVITTFMLATDPWLQQFVDQLTRVNRGRAFFASLERLGSFVLADYLRQRRKWVH